MTGLDSISENGDRKIGFPKFLYTNDLCSILLRYISLVIVLRYGYRFAACAQTCISR